MDAYYKKYKDDIEDQIRNQTIYKTLYPMLDNWTERNKVPCLICNITLASDSIKVHMTYLHPSEKCPNEKIHLEFYKCIICEKRMLWTHQTIGEHMKKNHKITIADYTRVNVENLIEQVNQAEKNYQQKKTVQKKYRIRYMRAPHMLFFSVKVFEKVSKLENSPFYRNGLQY